MRTRAELVTIIGGFITFILIFLLAQCAGSSITFEASPVATPTKTPMSPPLEIEVITKGELDDIDFVALFKPCFQGVADYLKGADYHQVMYTMCNMDDARKKYDDPVARLVDTVILGILIKGADDITVEDRDNLSASLDAYIYYGGSINPLPVGRFDPGGTNND